MSAPYFHAQHLYKRFGRQVVLRDVSVRFGSGEAIALFGANGAGKSTLLRILATLARPTRGSVEAFGDDAWKSREDVRRRIGVVGHQPFIYPELTCAENLRFYARMFGLDAAQVVPRALNEVGLGVRSDSPAGTLSRGLLQRLNLARAVLHQPTVLLLDEPDTGLDSIGRQVLAEIISNQIARDGAVVLTTHSFEFGLGVATRAISLREGSVTLDRDARSVSIADLERCVSTSLEAAVE